MADNSTGTQAQQIASEWGKLVTGQVAYLESAFTELGKLEARGAAQLLTGVEEAGRVAKESVAQVEKLAGEWRRLTLDAARRAAELLVPRP